MNLTSFSVRNWQFTVVVFAMLAALGLASWHSVPRLEDPPLDFPVFTIVAVYPGASPTDLERLVVTEVEERLDQLEHVKSIDSRMRDGVATVRIEFYEDQDADAKYDEVVREVNALRPRLPAELARLDIEKATTLEVNIVQVALVSPSAPYHQLDSLAEALEDRLAAVPGVREAQRWAAPERQSTSPSTSAGWRSSACPSGSCCRRSVGRARTFRGASRPDCAVTACASPEL
jgi:multidrug efflux pump subunit AcrB